MGLLFVIFSASTASPKIQRKCCAIGDIGASKIPASSPPKIHFRKIDGRDTRASALPAYIEVGEARAVSQNREQILYKMDF